MMTHEEKILAVRVKRKAGEFDRAVTSRAPDSIMFDAVTLECGHVSHVFPSEVQEKAYCAQCADNWLKGA